MRPANWVQRFLPSSRQFAQNLVFRFWRFPSHQRPINGGMGGSRPLSGGDDSGERQETTLDGPDHSGQFGGVSLARMAAAREAISSASVSFSILRSSTA